MEKVIYVEDKLKKAQEIYERRNYGRIDREDSIKQNRNSKEKNKNKFMYKNKKMKKIIVQVIVSITIYFTINHIYSNEYIFSTDVVNKTKGILATDINFNKIYNNIINYIKTNMQIDLTKNENIILENAIGGAESYIYQNIESIESSVQNIEKIESVTQEKSQYEKNIEKALKTTTYIWPLNGIITSRFGLRESDDDAIPKNHTGIDIGANIGTKIISATDGEVVLSSEIGDYGKHLKIQIGEVSLIYAHCHELYVKTGDFVKQGQEIAEVGSTGNSTGPHLHFEIRVSEEIINPDDILK